MGRLKNNEIYFTRARDDKDDVYMFFVKREVKTKYPTITVTHGVDAYIYSFSGEDWYHTNLSLSIETESYIEVGKQKRNAIRDLFLYKDIFPE